MSYIKNIYQKRLKICKAVCKLFTSELTLPSKLTSTRGNIGNLFILILSNNVDVDVINLKLLFINKKKIKFIDIGSFIKCFLFLYYERNIRNMFPKY